MSSTTTEAFRNVALESLIRKDYHENTLPIINAHILLCEKKFQRARRDIKPYRELALINSEVRNALDHAARSIPRTEASEVVDSMEMARWHLDMAQIYALIPLIDANRELLRSSKDYLAVHERRLLSKSFVEATDDVDDAAARMPLVISKILSPKVPNRMTVDTPSPDTMRTTSEIAIDMANLWTHSEDTFKDIRLAYNLPPVDVVQRRLRTADIKRAISYVLVTLLLVGAIQGIWANFLYDSLKDAVSSYFYTPPVIKLPPSPPMVHSPTE